MRDAALAAVAGLFLLGALLGRSRNEGYKHGGTAAMRRNVGPGDLCLAAAKQDGDLVLKFHYYYVREA